MQTYKNVDEYIASFTPEIQSILINLRQLITKLAPSSVEYLGYGMPGYKLNGKPLIYFAAFKNHLGIYPTPSGVEAFKSELNNYKTAKGSIQCPLSESIPYDLIEKIFKYRIAELSK